MAPGMKYLRSTHNVHDWWTVQGSGAYMLTVRWLKQLEVMILLIRAAPPPPPTSVILDLFLFNLPIYLPFYLCSHHYGNL